jgi:hypothetical protein
MPQRMEALRLNVYIQNIDILFVAIYHQVRPKYFQADSWPSASIGRYRWQK